MKLITLILLTKIQCSFKICLPLGVVSFDNIECIKCLIIFSTLGTSVANIQLKSSLSGKTLNGLIFKTNKNHV